MTLRRILSAVFVPLFLFMAVVFPMEKSYATGSLNLLYNHQMLINIGSQKQWANGDKGSGKDSRYNQSCSAFCLTYAHALITNGNEINDPKYYWGTNPPNVRWSKAGYTADYYASDDYNKLFVLQKAYDELKERRLPILYVTQSYSKVSYEHYVLVVGYQNVAKRDSLTEGNFLVIDSNKPSEVKTLGDTGLSGRVTLGHGGKVGIAYSKATNERVHWFGDWGKSDTNHWRDCIDPGCPDRVRWYNGPHVYDNDADTTCNTCGYVRSIHTHTYGDWRKDGTNHWHECTCGDKTDVAEHSFGEWTVTKEASTTEPGSKTRSCSACGFEETLEIPVLSHTHSYGTDWKNNETSHWHECTCGDKADMAAHSFRWIIDRAATATQKGSKHEECTVCGYRRAAVEIPATGTTTGGTTGGGSHWHPSVTTTPVPVIVIPPKTGDMTIWQSILHFLGIR